MSEGRGARRKLAAQLMEKYSPAEIGTAVRANEGPTGGREGGGEGEGISRLLFPGQVILPLEERGQYLFKSISLSASVPISSLEMGWGEGIPATFPHFHLSCSI